MYVKTNEVLNQIILVMLKSKIYKTESSVWNWVDTVHLSMQSFWASNVYPFSPWSRSHQKVSFLNINAGLINNLIGLSILLFHLSKREKLSEGLVGIHWQKLKHKVTQDVISSESFIYSSKKKKKSESFIFVKLIDTLSHEGGLPGHWQGCELYVCGVWIQSFVGSLGSRIPALLLLAEATSHFQAEPTTLSNHLSHIYVRVHVNVACVVLLWNS